MTQLVGDIIDLTRLDGGADGMQWEKSDLKRIADELDHTLIYETGTLREATRSALAEDGFAMTEVPFRPTAEHFAEYFYQRMTACSYTVAEATVYETPNNCASYTGEEQA